jgi:type VI secretion system protein ImpG
MTMFSDDFKAEVDYLFQLCEELGEAQPQLAPMLGRGADPAVARLVEGLAFSFARLRSRLDDDLPEVLHPILETLCPEVLRPIPSGTIVELVPSAKMTSKQTVNAGCTFASRPVSGVACIFRAATDCEVSPWKLSRVEIVGQDRRVLRLALELFGGVELAAAVPNALRLFFALPAAAALEARAFLLENVGEVAVRTPTRDTAIRLSAPVATFVDPAASSMADDGLVLPMASAFLGLRDYFVFPQRFAFIEVGDFEKCAALGPGVRHVEVDLSLREPLPKGIVLDTSTVLLHAVPALNVFQPPPLSIPLTGDKRGCRVQLAAELGDAEVYAIEGVSLVGRDLRVHPIEPWARFFPPTLDGDAPDAVRYEVHRAPSVLGPQVELTLSFAARSPWTLADKVAAEVALLATNGTRAASIGIGDVCATTATSPPLVTFRNVIPVTRSSPPALAGDRLWKVFRFLKATTSALTHAETLASLLALANVPALAQWPEAKPGIDVFGPLVGVDARCERQTARDELRSGTIVRVDLDTRRFTGAGDLHLFGEVLTRLFASTLGLRQWVELSLGDAQGRLLLARPRAYGARGGL